jgi:hypothetical protein
MNNKTISLNMAVFLVLSFISVLFGCGNGGGGDSSNIAMSDNFEYSANSPWTPSNGWTELQGGSWNIVGGGVTGNALQYHSNAIAVLANSYTGTDYTISARFMPVNLSASWSSGIIGRLQDQDHWYGALITNTGGNMTLQLIRDNGISLAVLQASAITTGTPLDASTWYTLTLKLSGTTITGTFTGGGYNVTINATDATYANGRAGIVGWNNNAAYDARFDNLTVTVP